MQRALLTALVLILITPACGGTTTTTSDSQPSASPTPTTGVSATFTPPPGDEATVVRIFDGDSFEAELDGEIVEVRMLGINAPEGFECHGDAARQRLRELTTDVRVILVADGEDDSDRFGRLLRSVYTDDQFVNGAMVGEGHAVALQSGDPEEATLVALSDRAFEAQVGMWSPQACGEGAPPAVEVVEVEYDPPGRDWENKAEEWVVIRNASTDTVDLGGWILRDESSTHRYEFERGESIEPGTELRIRTGCGDAGDADRYWCADDAVWSNGGDTVILQTAAGTVVDRVRYEGDF